MPPYQIDLRLWRIYTLGALVALALGGIVARLWYLQVIRHEHYSAKVRGTSRVTVRIPSIRGEIRDRNGVLLVQNRASRSVDFYLPAMIDGYRRIHRDVPVHNYEARVRGMLRRMEEPDIVQIVNDAIIPRLQELTDDVCDYSSTSLRRHYRQRDQVPFTYLEDIDFPTLARLAEHALGLPGVDVSIKPVRDYLHGALAAHILGYVGPPANLDQEPDIRQFDYYQEDVVGVSQIEKTYDSFLRGQPGVRTLQKNAKGGIEGVVSETPPRPGNNVLLTIDARIQMIAERALRLAGRAAAVVIDPNNGDVLAMASAPSYDPNIFIPSISEADWEKLRSDPTQPLNSRALDSFPPGSTYKLVIALAGLRKGMGRSAYFTCSGGVQYGKKMMKCWIAERGGAHGTLDLVSAIRVSCNAYFYQYANAAGIEIINDTGQLLGLGQPSQIPLTSERPGILPGPEWLAANSPEERWSSGYTANTAIGQGFVTATPLQMAIVAATIANGGTCYHPRLVDRIVDPQGAVVRQDPPSVRSNLLEHGLTPERVELVRRGMWEVVNSDSGTASRARVKGVEVAGKTGTAQHTLRGKRDNIAWFVCFAPYQKPRFAICVMVQNAKSGGQVAAPLAAKIIEESLALDRGYQPPIEALAPAPGDFDHRESITPEGALPPEYAMADDGETGNHLDQPPPSRAPRESEEAATAKPQIKPQADEGGRVRRDDGRPRGFLQRLFSRDRVQKERSEPSRRR